MIVNLTSIFNAYHDYVLDNCHEQRTIYITYVIFSDSSHMKTSYVIASISVLLNIMLVVCLFSNRPESGGEKTPFESFSQERAAYPYLSARIFAENQNDLLINFKPLRTALNQYAGGLKNRTGIYFEYLPTGNNIGVNEKEEFLPASLLKTPLAMGALKLIEDNKVDPDTTLTIRDEDLDTLYGDLWKRGVGAKISIMDTIEYLITHSDNTASRLLIYAVSGAVIEDVFDSLDIPKQVNQKEKKPVVTPKNYSSILRCLYLSCYLNKKYSNTLLDMLTRTVYTDKIPAGVPKVIKVAHKIGLTTNKEGVDVYTDCGIVYAPKRPYILCIMVEGEEDTARDIMKEVSRMIYEYVSSVT